MRDKSSQAVTISLSECASFFSFIESCGRFMLTIPLFSINMLLFNLLFQGRRNQKEGGQMHPPPRFLQISKIYLNQGGWADYARHIATRLPDFRTFRGPYLFLLARNITWFPTDIATTTNVRFS